MCTCCTCLVCYVMYLDVHTKSHLRSHAHLIISLVNARSEQKSGYSYSGCILFSLSPHLLISRRFTRTTTAVVAQKQREKDISVAHTYIHNFSLSLCLTFHRHEVSKKAEGERIHHTTGLNSLSVFADQCLALDLPFASLFGLKWEDVNLSSLSLPNQSRTH